uniref:Integrase catalytic domain-containing protein n=1 Tax=Megaselia scalaris TaxID=36166 RepID=T1GVB7_MEGSC
MPEVYPIPNQEARTSSDVSIKKWVSTFGVPIEIQSDQGRNFETTLFSKMWKTLGMNKTTKTTPLHPQSNSQWLTVLLFIIQ